MRTGAFTSCVTRLVLAPMPFWIGSVFARVMPPGISVGEIV